MRLRAVLLVAAFAACSKPSIEDCRKAVLNVQKVRGLEDSGSAPDPEPAIRKCRATANPKTVKCLIAAKTPAQIDACEPKKK